ncbi:MAG: family 2 glycosyl transferase [Rhodocyclales bacterium]|nr:family 2 glycosyl transferase [Rhodocyclales bacterium]
MQNLDLIIATYNRPALLDFTLDSIAQAVMPPDLHVRVLVADNNSSAANQNANRAAMARHPSLDLAYVFETRQGKSWALNTAIAASTTDYIAFIDDDEKLDSKWFETAAHYLREGIADYIGGPYKPDWATSPPVWLPATIGKYPAVIGWIEQSDKAQSFDAFGGGLCGGNCIIRRSALNEIGGFSTQVGRFANNLMCGEDDELHRQLRLHGKVGMYDPQLIIYHFIPVQRMTMKYHLRWAFWSGVSNGVRLAWLPAEPVSTIFGIARYRFGAALRGVFNWSGSLVPAQTDRRRAEGFAGLMDAFYLVGMIYGKHFFRAKSPQAAAV